MRILFMGTPEFAVEQLRRLVEDGHDICGVFTQPDKPKNRGMKMTFSPVKKYALSQGLAVYQPTKMRDGTALALVRELKPELIVVAAYGRILPEDILAVPDKGCINVHSSILPKYRGAAPINWAIINGETQTGVTTFFLDHDIDTGRIIMSKSFDIPDDADVEYVYDGLMHLGAQLCLETLEHIVATDGHPATVAQSEKIEDKDLKDAPKLFKENCEINWNQKAKQVYDFVRGLCPIPGAWTNLITQDGKETLLKVYRTSKTGQSTTAAPGTICIEGKRLLVATIDEWLCFEELQLAGKKRMMARDFMNGMKELDQCHMG